MEGQQPNEIFLINAGKFEQAQVIGDRYFREGSYLKAIEVFRKIIEKNYGISFQIEGLGSSEHSISRYEWFIYRWYDEQTKQGSIRGNVFDALSLCYNQIRGEKQADDGLLWYQDMIGTRQCYQLYMGYANLLSNKARYDEAIKMYNRVILYRPNLVNAYVCIAMIYEYRRIQKTKAIEMANKILEMDPNNMYAVFILTRNENNIDQKIQKLQAASARFPEYVRIANDVGIAYGTKKQHKQAIKWYKKCIEKAPEYAAAYNNVGVRTEMLGQYEQALPWYLKACQLDPEYKAAHKNATDIFDQLKYNDDRIIAEMDKYAKLNPFMFYYYLGLAYYDKDKVQKSIEWYKRAEQLNSSNFQLMNSMGISYDQIKDYDRAQQYYSTCIALNPKYHMAYYNLGILQKSRKNIDAAANWYKKAIQVNPRYNKPYNNLGNIYKNEKKYDEAIYCFEKAVQLNTTYTLGWTNLAVCLMNSQRYQEAFNAFARAKQLLPTDNNGLSEGNKAFLKESLQKFEKQGEKWKKTTNLSHDQKQNLRHLIHSYEANFKQAPSVIKVAEVSNEIALRPQIIETVQCIYKDQFLLKDCQRLFNAVERLCLKDIEYFHIVPLYFVQHFLKGIFEICKSPLQIQEELSNFIKGITLQRQLVIKNKISKVDYDIEAVGKALSGYGFPSQAKINLFKESAFFGSYQALYAQIEKVNKQAEKSLNDFTQLLEAIRVRSNGVSKGAKMTLPKRASQQFTIMSHIVEKLFASQMNNAWKNSIVKKLGQFVLLEGEKATTAAVIHKIIDLWSDQITLILKQRFNKQVETPCCLQDLLKGTLVFETIEDLLKAIEACDKLCRLKGFQILKLRNDLQSAYVREVVIVIKVNDSISELHLVKRRGENQSQFLNELQEIEQSPLGSIFGSYLYLSRRFKYPLVANCKDIETKLKESPVAVAARYIINVLQAQP